MAKNIMPYDKFFRFSQQVRVLIHLKDKKHLDLNAEISSIAGDFVMLEILGDGIPERELAGRIGSRVSFSGITEIGICKCNALLEQTSGPKQIGLRLSGAVDEQQRREYFRLDVFLPLLYSIPELQHTKAVAEMWRDRRDHMLSLPAPRMFPYGTGYRVIGWQDHDAILPQSINLSGGGFRFRIGQFAAPGTSMLVELFLPVAPTKVIAVLAEVVRCNEIALRLEKGTCFSTAMRFLEIDDNDREAIICFLFMEQRKVLLESREKSFPGDTDAAR
jgi:hypothetical protein